MEALSQAKKLIKECLQTQNTYLDLGNCGITNLAAIPELFECTHIETLILSNRWYDDAKREFIDSKNSGSLNKIEYITEDIGKLEKLQNLKIGGSFHYFNVMPFWNTFHIKDIHFLKALHKLKALDLSYNQITDYSFLKDLVGLTSLSLSDNKITDYSFLKDLVGLTSLDLSDNKITDYSFLKDLDGLTSLSLSSNQITDIRFLKDLVGLTSLSLSYNQITDIRFLKDLVGLTSLDLRYNKITDIRFLKDLVGLTSLDLSDNKITDIRFLKDLVGLTSLDLSDNKITDYSFLKDLDGLTSLSLRYNKITDIRFLKNLVGLTSLDLRSNQITDIRFLKDLVGLTSLSLSDNQITDYSFLKDLVGLTSLSLSSNQITDIRFLKDLVGLTSLDLRSNQITDIRFLKDLVGLTSLSLSDNQITDYSFLKDLDGLTSLDLSDNQITDIRFLKDLDGLTSLSLSSNQITDIRFLKDLVGLTSLSLSYNQITDIRFLKDLDGLTSLSLSSNQITDIRFLKDLVGLTSLSLSSNQITDIRFLKDLDGLISLDLSYNQITDIKSLVPFIKKGRKISTEEYRGDIRLYKNPLGSPPQDVVEQGNAAVLRYFEALKRKDVKEVQLLEAKVLLLGEGKTGKTSLRIKIEDENKELPKIEDRTRGIDIYNYEFPANNDTFICHIWDFGGQDVLYQVHRFFLSNDALYVLVTDSRADQGNKYEEWLQTIEIFTKENNNNKIILLQNLKFGDTPANIDISDYKKYYNIVDGKVFEVDLSFSEAKHRETFRAFKQVIQNRLEELPHVQRKILSDWLNVRKELEELLEINTYLINLSQYAKICEKHKVEDKERQKDLLRYLHKLGIVLWYEDYPAIKQKVILNPEWITTALYRIIDSKDIRAKNGKLEQEDVEHLWNEPMYVDFHNELLEMLKIFRLAYKRRHENAYIVPSLMSTVIPEKHENWNPKEKWEIKYKYPRLMPRGIVNQLAAELCKYVDSDFEDVWAFGVVFTIKNAKAKVQVNRNLKQISVEAYGNERLMLMQDIVKAMKDIHETYKGLDFDIEIPCVCEKCSTLSSVKKTYHDYNEDIEREIEDNRDDIYCRNLRGHIKIAPILESSGFALPYTLVEILREKDARHKMHEIDDRERLRRIENTTEKTLKYSKKTKKNTKEILEKFNTFFEHLLSLDENLKLNKEEIIQAVEEISITQKQAIFDDIHKALESLYEAMDEQQKEYLDTLNTKGGNLEMKIKASIPLLNLVGLDIGIESDFDIKNWSQKMYKKYEVKLFKLFGYI